MEKGAKFKIDFCPDVGHTLHYVDRLWYSILTYKIYLASDTSLNTNCFAYVYIVIYVKQVINLPWSKFHHEILMHIGYVVGL